jgi:hypothetical protein
MNTRIYILLQKTNQDMSSTSQSVLGIISQDLRMLELRSNDETSNVGTRWTIEEDTKLVQEIIENKTYEEIALEHKRTVLGIKLRVISHIIYPKIKDAVAAATYEDADMEALALEYKIDTSQLIRQIDKLRMKETVKKEKQKPKPINDDMPTNKEILEYLKQLDKKIDEINSKLDNLEYLR